MEMALGGKRPVHAAPRADEPRHPRHLHARANGPCDPLAALREAYAGEPFVHVSERRPRPNGRWAPTPSTSPRATTSAPAGSSRIAALDNLVKGAAGQMIQCANLMLGLDESGRPADRGSLAVSVTAAQGFVAAGCHAGIKRAATTWR